MDSNTEITPGLQTLLGDCRAAFLMAGADVTLADVVGRELNQLSLPELTYYFNKLLQFDTPVAITGLTATLGPRHACELFLRNHLIPVLYQDPAVVAKIKASSHADTLPAKYAA